MKSKIKQLLKDFLYSRYSPDALSNIYFKKKEKSDRKILTESIRENSDLMKTIPSDQHNYWNSRIDNVLKAPENANIPRVENAGQFENDMLVMHNGVKVDPLSYYNFPLLKMLKDNKGVYEPEEERIFQEVIKNINSDKELTMLELGSYWSFYSMWFLSLFPEAKCYMVERDKRNLFYGKRNFSLNDMHGKFIHACIGKKKNKKFNTTTVDIICSDNNISFLDILHLDIQGFELEILIGSRRMLSQNRIGYTFISTHSNQLHKDCKAYLKQFDFDEVASVDLNNTSSWGGILVMKSTRYFGVEKVELETLKEKV